MDFSGQYLRLCYFLSSLSDASTTLTRLDSCTNEFGCKIND